MALKIVHLCDVHSSKGEDIAASYAHTIAIDGGTFAIDLCPTCDQERFTPLVAFLDAFGLLTDGAVDPREAVAEDLREIYARTGLDLSAPAPERSEKRQTHARASTVRPSAPVRSETQQEAPVTTESHPEDQEATPLMRERRRKTLALLRDAGSGLTVNEIADRLGVASRSSLADSVLSPLRARGDLEFIGMRWWLSENVPEGMREESARQRAAVRLRDEVPRVCPVDGETFPRPTRWTDHCTNVHGVRPVELLGLTCPMDGESFENPQTLGMHARREHDCVHTPQLFQLAVKEGDPLGVVEDVKKRAQS